MLMTHFARLDVTVPVIFIVVTGCLTLLLYVCTVDPKSDELIQQLHLIIALYGYTNVCVGFIVGYAILRSFVDAEYLERETKQEYVCELCAARAALL